MTLLKIKCFPDEVLRGRAKEVKNFDNNLERLAKDMLQTMYHESGVGLAAPQVGLLTRLIVVDVSRDEKEPLVLVNPKIVKQEGKVSGEEGCLSIPGYRDTVERSKVISVEAQDINGETIAFDAQGLLSICIQHEIDHLNGVLFIDHLSRLKREMFRKWFKKQEPKT